MSDFNNVNSRAEDILVKMIDGKSLAGIRPQSRLEELLIQLNDTIRDASGSGGLSDNFLKLDVYDDDGDYYVVKKLGNGDTSPITGEEIARSKSKIITVGGRVVVELGETRVNSSSGHTILKNMMTTMCSNADSIGNANELLLKVYAVDYNTANTKLSIRKVQLI